MTKILIIEDEASLREDLLDLLEGEGFEATGAAEGQAGIDLARSWQPDLIICDVLMPGIDGYGVLETLRQDQSMALIPFIFLTAKGTGPDLRQGMTLGADDYLVKPYKQSELLAAIATRLHKHDSILQLQEKIESLESTSLLQEDFLATTSENIRGPLTNIAMAVKMLRTVPNRDAQQRYLDLLQVESSREVKLIDDLLDLQRLENHNYIPRLQPISLQTWVPVVVEPLRLQAQARQQQLHIVVPPYLPALLFDGASLQRVVVELLLNACKYTAPGGSISLEVRRELSGDSAATTYFVISNQAELPEDVLPKLFDPFYRVPGGDRWHQGGSGLGLALVKRLVDVQSGTLNIKCQPGWIQVWIGFDAEVAPPVVVA